MINEEDEIAFILWGVDTGNGSRRDWSAFESKDKYLRMARAAILQMRVLQIVQ